jgi:hypothetical protein
MPHYVCIKQNRPGESGAAALATLAHYYGLARDMRALLGLDSLKLDLFYLLFVSRKLGFQAVPLEGEYADLPAVTRPNIVLFKGAKEEEITFRVLYEIHAGSALIGNVETGEIARLDKDTFTQLWTGDAVQILPDEEEFAGLRQQVMALHNPWVQFRRAVGLSPRSIARLLFYPAVVAVMMAVGVGALHVQLWSTRFILSAIGLCVMLSLWSAIFSPSCRSCEHVARLAGDVPLPALGVAFYLALLVAALLAPPLLWSSGIFFACGVHVWLLLMLARSRLWCWSCAAIALTILSAAALYAVTTGGMLVLAAASCLSGVALAWISTSYARQLYQLQSRHSAYRLASQVAHAGDAVPPGHVRLVVYTRKHCPLCSFYETVVRPALEEEFGAVVTTEERDAEQEKIATPLIIVSGAMCLSVLGLSTEEGYAQVKMAIEAALNPAFAPLKTLGGIYMLGPLAHSESAL